MQVGGGKSLLFQLPVWLDSSAITIVVVPLVALRTDMMLSEWESRAQPDHASIVLITVKECIVNGAVLAHDLGII